MSETKHGGLVLRSSLAVGAALSVVSAFVAVPALMATAGAASGDICPPAR